MKTGILLINLGTPDEPTTSAVKRYLRQFLSDPRVIDIHPIGRQLLLNLIILPFRSPKSAAAYQKIWSQEGSPLLVHTTNLAREVSEKLGPEYAVEFGMRYGNPSLASALKKLVDRGVQKIRVLPLFPQYAASSTGSAIAEIYRVAGKYWDVPSLEILPPFFDHPGYIQSFAEVGKETLERMKPDHILFSFHGLPERHIKKSDCSADKHCLSSKNCCDTINAKESQCYRAQCFSTAKAIANKLDLNPDSYTISFQSRLGRTPWIKPYTDLLLIDLVKSGKKKIAVFCPAFVADCLETLEEIGIRARESALEHGATDLELILSLNTHASWIEAVCQMVR